jgi:predicted AlkP superfamily phosphohydrolase/phosphomutase
MQSLALVAAWLAVLGPFPGVAAPGFQRVVLLSVDSGADWVVDRLIAAGKAPAFAAMAREGAAADGMVTVMPSLTAVSHASLWTGTLPRFTGVAGNTMPGNSPAEHSLFDARSGYLASALEAEPIWITAARGGRRVLVAQATGGFPFDPRFADRILHFDVYANERLPAAIVRGRLVDGRFSFRVGDTQATLMLDDAGGLRLTVDDQSSHIGKTAAGYSSPLPAAVGGQPGRFRAGVLAFDQLTQDVTLYRGDVFDVRSNHPGQLPAFTAAAGVALGESAASLYEAGRLGRTYAEGGDGSAERHLLESAIANQAYFDGALQYAAGRPWDLLVLYVPNMDMLGHALMGMLDPDSPRFDAPLAARVWPVYEEGFRRCADDYVAEIRRLFPDATLLVGADHGVEGNGRAFYPNVALRRAGLLAIDAHGRIDLARTSAVFLYSHGGGVYVNATTRRGGIVPPGDREAVKRAAAAALLSARDPDAGTPLVTALIDAEYAGKSLGIGGPRAPDLYVEPAPGYQLYVSANRPAIVGPGPPTGSGAHGPAPWRRKLHAIFYAAGPGVRAGARLGLVRTIDVAPTVARLLGVPPPADAIGLPLAIEPVP